MMDANSEWCSFCDAIFRSGVWITATDQSVAVYRCPECNRGWNTMEPAVMATGSSAAGFAAP